MRSSRRPAKQSRHLIEQLERRLVMSAWFVAPTGADANPGTLAQPFASIQAAANAAQPGDTVYICGGTYHETVTPALSGTTSAPITYQAYNNELVTIDGADAVTGWSSFNGSVYQAPQSWDLGAGSNQVFVDGKMVNEARFPNSSANVSTPTWAKMTSVTSSIAASATAMSTATIYNSSLNQPAGSWVGAIAHLALGQEWVDQTAVVTASSPGSITVSFLAESTSQIPKAGNRFYIVGAAVALDSAGEWFRNPATGQIDLWSPASDNPSGHAVEAKARQYGFDLSGLSNITVQGINLFACTINTDADSTHDTLNNLNASYVSHSIGISPDTTDPWGAKLHAHTTGIILNGNDNVLENSTIAYSSGDGVFLGGYGNTVQNCTIHDVAYEAGDEAGVTTLGDDESVLYNTIYNAGRSGIVCRYTTDSHILHNIVHDVGLQMTDLGAIYTWGTDGEGTEIGYNICYNVHTAGYGAAGIYLDNGSQNFLVDHNVTWNVDFGIKLGPPTWNVTIVNNTFNAITYGLETSGNADMTGCIVVNDIFSKHCLLSATAKTVTNDIFFETAPKFVNASANNYQLAAGSPAINTGKAMSPITNGYSGSLPDIGAYEYGVAPFKSGANAPPVIAPPPPVNPPAPPVVVAPPPPVVTPPSTSMQYAAKAYTSQWGVVTSGSGVKFTQQWGWAAYGKLDFGTGLSQFILQVSHTATVDQKIDLRIDSASGPTVAIIDIPPVSAASSASVRTLITALTTKVTGVHSIFLVLRSVPTSGEIDGFSVKNP